MHARYRRTMARSPQREILSFRFPEPIQRVTARGSRIFVLPMQQATTISIGAYALIDPAAVPIAGLAHLTATMLSRGTRHRSERQFATRVDVLGASFQAGSTHRSIGAEITGLPETADELIALLAESLSEPRFDPAEFEKAKQQHLASFPIRLADSAYRVRRIFQKLRFPGHSYSASLYGWPSSVAQITIEDVRQWYQALVEGQPWRILATGALDPVRGTAALEQSFAAIGGSGDATISPPPSPPAAIGIGQGVMTDQVELRLGHPAPSLTSDDYAATILIATAFAGHFRSRINMLVREQEGLTYGAYGGVTAGKDHGTFILSTSTTPENLPRMLSLLYAEWDRLVQEPLREDELHQARQSLYNNFWRSIETPDGTAAIALDLAINDLPADYYTRLLAEIDQLDPAALLAVQQRVFDPSRMLTAAVGELDVIARALAPYGSPHHIVLEEEQQ